MQQETSNISPTANCQSPIANGQYTESTRLPWLDFASGIMILWMIMGHAISAAWGYEVRDLWGIRDASLLPKGVHAFINNEGALELLSPCVVFPYLHFFMPWFFYKSGHFFQKRSVKTLWKKDWNKLMKTFIIWSIVGYVFFLFFGWLNDSLTLRSATYSVIRGLFLRGYIPINNALWFLLSLFGVRLMANWLLPERVDRFFGVRIVGVVLLGYAISYLAYRFNHRLLPYWVANGAAGLSFFALGYAMRDWEQKWWLVVPCAIVYISGCVLGFVHVGMLDNKLWLGNYFLWIPQAFCCIVFFNFVCRKLCKYIHIKPIEWVGKNAMAIYVMHYVIVIILVDILQYYDVCLSSQWVMSLILFAYVLILPLCCWIMNVVQNKR